MASWKEIFVKLDYIEYKIIFTKHSLERMEQRWISLEQIIESIEKYDKYFESYWKKVVEKYLKTNTIRTVFDFREDNIILITSMFLWK
jgi:hypothetical protein